MDMPDARPLIISAEETSIGTVLDDVDVDADVAVEDAE